MGTCRNRWAGYFRAFSPTRGVRKALNFAFMPNESTAVATFIARWQPADGSELANAQTFVRELCELLGVPVPSTPNATPRKPKAPSAGCAPRSRILSQHRLQWRGWR